jgi:hypothetical protein
VMLSARDCCQGLNAFFSIFQRQEAHNASSVTCGQQALTSWKSGGLALSGNPQQDSGWSHFYIDNAHHAERPWKIRR